MKIRNIFPKRHAMLSFLLASGSISAAHAAMDATSILTFTASTTAGLTRPVDGAGSWFGMEAGDFNFDGVPDTIHTPISSNEGIKLGIIQNADGSHNGAPDGTELPSVDNPWSFFSNTGMHGVNVTPITVVTDDGNGNVTLDMSGWTVDWNGGEIDMGAGADAVVTCANLCEFGDTFILEYSAVVPSGQFQGVPYSLHLEGTIEQPPAVNSTPVAADLTATVDRKAAFRSYTPESINVLLNVSDPDGSSDLDPTTVTIVTAATNGVATVDPVTGAISYIPNDGVIGAASDSFTYTVTDLGGPLGAGNELTSNIATVTIDVVNAVPEAVNDSASIDSSLVSSVNIDVISNDVDKDGTIDPTTVSIVDDVTLAMGSTSVDPVTGVVTYTPDAAFSGIASFTYVVKDNDGLLVPVKALVNITVSTGGGILEKTTYLVFNTGKAAGTIEPPPGQGSWFSMEVKPGEKLHTPISGFDHVRLSESETQPGLEDAPLIDQPWNFFGNKGVHRTTTPITILTDDENGNVKLNFKGWAVSWNGIVNIPMGDGQDNGVATLTCGTDCSNFDTFVLDYHAIVPPGDPSGFGGVNYRLHLEGIINRDGPIYGGGCTDTNVCPYSVSSASALDANGNPIVFNAGSFARSLGNFTGTGLTSEQIGIKDPMLNEDDGMQCIGGCVDFMISELTTDYADIVIKLSDPIEDGAIYRKLINGVWKNFDQSSGDLIGSAQADSNGNCQTAEGVFSVGLRAGNTCLYLRIHDGGPNDADGIKNGKIVDPSGVLLPGSSNVPEGSTDGCSMSGKSVDILARSDWFILAIFIGWLGFISYRSRT